MSFGENAIILDIFFKKANIYIYTYLGKKAL